MLHLQGEKVCTRNCGLAEVLSPQITKKIGSANRKFVPHLRKVRKSNTLCKSANFWICNLPTAPPPLLKIQCTYPRRTMAGPSSTV
jgi:hypothetical protein